MEQSSEKKEMGIVQEKSQIKQWIPRILLAVILLALSAYLLKGDVWTFWTWWLLAALLGVAAMPVTGILFGRFEDKGWIFSKVLAIGATGFFTWFLVAIKLLPFTSLTCLGVVLACGLFCFFLQKKHVAKKNPASVEDMMAQSFSEDESKTVSDVINGAVAKIGEKITIRRFNRVEGIVDTYVHLGGKIGVLLQISNNEFPAVAHDVAMQIAAAKPTCLRKEDCDQAELEHEREILREQAKNDPKPKPAAIIEKMVEGRIEKYYKEVCLLEQPFVKNPDESVSQMINGRFEVIGFTRYEMGEGLQKRTEDFAAEVMAQTKKA